MSKNPLSTIVPMDKSNTKLVFSSIEHGFDRIPDEIIEWTHLESLETGAIPIDETSLEKLLKLNNLKELKIPNFNSINFPLALMDIGSLENLTINSNELSFLPPDLRYWSRLGYLNLHECKALSEIHGLPPNLHYLNVSRTAMGVIHPKIFDLTEIRKLVAAGLGLKVIPTEIFDMTSLLSLFLPENRIKSISKKISQLKDLEELYMYDNLFKQFPTNLLELKRLETIELSKNGIDFIPAEISNMTNLKSINLGNNNLSTFPSAILKCPKIERIRLASYNNNSFKNSITKIPEEIVNCNTLKELDLFGVIVENVPKEIVTTGWEAIRNFFLSKLEAENEEFLFEAKLVLVGRGNVGKTVLTKKLINPDYILDSSETTLGINVMRIPYYSKVKIGTDEVKFKLNIWDFGGQEKYDATHQLFITKRSIYLFLTEAREESNYLDFYYWLNTIQLFSNNSPTIIVLSKADERRKTLPESIYKEKFDNILEFIEVSCADGYEMTIERLRICLNKAIYLLPQTKLKLSNRWIEIRNTIEELSKEKDYISYKEYLEICSLHQLDKKRADFLSQFLNDLGVIIHHQFDLLLKECVFINTDWCVDGMYKLLDSNSVTNGRFTLDDLDDVWEEDRFRDKKAELLKLLHQYHLCFELRDGSGFISPGLLPPDKPKKFTWDRTSNLQFEYVYKFMPSGLLSRFIVKSHSFVKENIFWKHGVVLEYEETKALIEEDYINNRIKISLAGKNKKGLLSAIRMYIDEVHKDFDKASKLSFEEMVPCNCSECSTADFPHFYKFEVLRKFQSKGRISTPCEISSDDVQINSLIDDIQINRTDVRLNTNDDLKDYILGVINNVLEKEISLKSSYMNFWRDSKCSVPKNEIEVQPYISNTLDHYCKFKGIQLSREVMEANGSVDILLSTRNEGNQVLSVCIEIKKAHHDDVDSAIGTQLPLYMKSVGTKAGIYLVVWLKNDAHNFPKKFNSMDDLQKTIESNNPSSQNISIKILNCCRSVNPSKAQVNEE